MSCGGFNCPKLMALFSKPADVTANRKKINGQKGRGVYEKYVDGPVS
jgi:hypothetical protein